jgi:hypothetical protein
MKDHGLSGGFHSEPGCKQSSFRTKCGEYIRSDFIDWHRTDNGWEVKGDMLRFCGNSETDGQKPRWSTSE